MVQLRWGVVCIKGNFRQNNEDAFHVDPDGRFFIVADGMGGQNAGERASGIATEVIPLKLGALNFDESDEKRVAEGVDNAVRSANQEIMALGELDPACKNLGTTVVLSVVSGDRLYIGNIGDSRAYLFRDENLKMLTRDHTVTAALVESGTITAEEAKTHRYNNMLHRYLGSSEANKGAEIISLDPQTGDRLLLCSDGVTGGVEDDGLAKLLSTVSDPQDCSEQIVKAAEDGGSKDNITCIIVDIIG